MSKQTEPKFRKQTLSVPGYGQGIWWLMAASVLVLFALFALESNRAISGSFGIGRSVEVERIPAEEARGLGVSARRR
jgi:hypothetical protein